MQSGHKQGRLLTLRAEGYEAYIGIFEGANRSSGSGGVHCVGKF
jgi:hypothetical protein